MKPIENLQYLWVAAGERFDIEFSMNLPTQPPATPWPAIQLQFIGYTDLTNSSSGLCSIAYLKIGGYNDIDESYTVPSDCSDFLNYNVIFPTDVRTLNPPGKKYENFATRVQDPYNDTYPSGNIYPVDMRSNHVTITQPLIRDFPVESTNDPTYIAFENLTTFNNIRTNFPKTPYLLQNPEQSAQRCPEDSPPLGDNENFRVCQHVTKYPFVSYPFSPIWWVETILINTNMANGYH